MKLPCFAACAVSLALVLASLEVGAQPRFVCERSGRCAECRVLSATGMAPSNCASEDDPACLSVGGVCAQLLLADRLAIERICIPAGAVIACDCSARCGTNLGAFECDRIPRCSSGAARCVSSECALDGGAPTDASGRFDVPSFADRRPVDDAGAVFDAPTPMDLATQDLPTDLAEPTDIVPRDVLTDTPPPDRSPPRDLAATDGPVVRDVLVSADRPQPDLEVVGGGGCATAPPRGGAAGIALALTALLARRRRSEHRR
jgi:hypothetical protein